MDLRELFEKIYYGKIKEQDVIVQHTKEYGEEYDRYILNDGFDFWIYNGDGVLSLNFFKNDYDENYSATFSIISKEEFEKRLEETRKRNKIKELEAELEKLKQQ